MPNLDIEMKCTGVVAGVDEAGRGPWAGPVVAAAVILPAAVPDGLLTGLNDSKKLTPARREALLGPLKECADIGIGAASVAEIERDNILSATYKAMRRALADLDKAPDVALIDGNRVPPGLSCTGRAVVKGDGLSLSIAAASIVAKVTRDRIMASLGARYPAFGWERNAGYGTRQHQDGLTAAGITAHHRRTYAPIAKMLSPEESKAPDIA